MNKKIWAVFLLGFCLSTGTVYASAHSRERNVFNRLTDWRATVTKPSAEKQAIVDRRIERRAVKREADENYKNKKRELNRKYHEELVAISNEEITPEVMAQKLKDAYADHKAELQDLRRSSRAINRL